MAAPEVRRARSGPSGATPPGTGLAATPGARPDAGPAPGSPAPRHPGLAGASGRARRPATRLVTGAAPGWASAAGRGGRRGGGGGCGARRRRAAPPWEAPESSSSDQYPFQENTVLLREAGSGALPRRQTAVISFLCRVIRLLTHPKKHSPPRAPLWGSALPHTVWLSRPVTFVFPTLGSGPHQEDNSALRENLKGDAKEGARGRQREASLAEEHRGPWGQCARAPTERVPVWPGPGS